MSFWKVSNQKFREVARAVSPVIGVVLMVAIVVLLAAVVAGAVLSFDDRLQEPDLEPDEDEDEVGNPWGEDELFAPEDSTAGAEDVRYRILFELDEDDELVGDDELGDVTIWIDYDDFNMFDGVEDDSFESLEINGEEEDTDDVEMESQIEDEQSELEIETEGVDHEFEAGDEVILIFDNVDNPAEAGEYTVDIEIDDDEREGTLEIVDETEQNLARRRLQLYFFR